MQCRKLPYYVTAWLCAVYSLASSAQSVQLNIFVNPQAPSLFGKWNENPGPFQISATNLSASAADVHIMLEFKGSDGKTVAKTADASALPTITLQPGGNSISSQQIFSTDYFTISPAYEASLGRNGSFPAGQFDLVASAVSASTGQVVSVADAAAFFLIDRFQAPLLIYPADGAQICGSSFTNTLFQWTPALQENFSFPAYNHFVLTEIYAGQTTAEALMSNVPIVEQFLPMNQSQWLWPENLIAPGDSQSYAWGVNIYDYHEAEIAHFNNPYHTTCRNDTVKKKDSLINIAITPYDPYHPHTYTKDACSMPGYKLLKGTPVMLGMLLDNPSLFPYPRALPIRAEGKDKDVMTLICSGCSGTISEMPMVIKDQVGDFKWTLLSDKGSLNTPFDLKDIDDLAKKIAELLEKLKAVTDSLDDVTKQLNGGLDKKKDFLDKEIEKHKAQKKTFEDSKNNLMKSLDSLSKVIGDKEKNIAALKSQMADKKARIKELQTRIDSATKALKGGPGKDETALQDQIGKKRKEIQNLKDQLANDEEKWGDELDNLQTDLNDAQKEIEDALNKYNSAKDKLEALAKQISVMESQLMKNADGKKFLIIYNDWEQKLKAFLSSYDKNGSIGSLGKQTTDAGLNVLSSSNISIRSGNLMDFNTLMANLQSKISGSCTGANDNDYCKAAMKEVKEAGKALSNDLGYLAPGNFVLDPLLFKKVDSLRKNISGAEGSLVPLKNAIQKAYDKYNALQEKLDNKMGETAQKRQDEKDKIESEETELDGMEANLKQLNDNRLADEDAKRKSRLDELSKLKDELAENQNDFAVLGDSIYHLDLELKVAKGGQTDLQDQIKKADENIKAEQDAIDNLEAQKKKLDSDKKNLEKHKKALEDQKKAIEDELEKLKAKKDDKLKGTKTAEGPYVYYIPPPLEDIIKDQAKFQELKDSVTSAEIGLQKAYANKGAVQGKLAKEIEKIAANLVKYQTALKTIEESEKKINELGDGLAKDKTKKYQDYLAKQQEAQTNSQKAKADASKAEQDEKKADTDKEAAEKDLDEVKDKIKEKKEKADELEKSLSDIKAEQDNEEKLLENARKTLQENAAAVDEEEANLKSLEAKLAQAKNDLTRAGALQKDDEVNKIRADIQNLEAQIKLSRDTKLPSLRSKTASTAESIKAAIKRVEAVQAKDKKAMEDLKKALEELRDLYTDQIKKNEKFEGAQTKLDEKKRKKEEADKTFEGAEKTREELQEDIAKQVDGDKDIKKKDDGKKAAEEAKAKAEDDKTKAENDINESVKIKAEIAKTKAALEAAKEKLKTAKQNLRDFLVKEFKEVSFEAKIQLDAVDKKVDQWRSADGPAKPIIATVTYANTRIPIFDGKAAKDSMPNEPTITSTCNPDFSFDYPPESNVTTPNVGNEPRTIALIYKDGEPIWPEWPVIQDAALLAKDVVPVTCDGTDEDHIKRWCASSGINCVNSDVLNDPIKDLGHYTFEVGDGTIVGYNPIHPLMFWETKKVDKPQKEKPEEVRVKYFADDFGADPEKKDKTNPNVKVGVLLECSKDTTAVPEAVYKLQGRTVTGDHLPLSAEEIEFEVKLVKGEAKNYGFDGTSMKVTKNTDGGGYGKADFNFGKGYAEFHISIRWKRGGNIIDEKQMKAVTPLLLHLYKFSTGAPSFAWDAALKLLDGGGDPAGAVAGFPKKGKDDDAKTLTLRGVAGLMDFDREFVNDETLEFTCSKKTDPPKDKTKVYGLGKTHISGVKDKENCELTVTTESKYRPVTRPEKDSKSFSNKKGDKFKIGPAASPFIIVMDEPFSPDEAVNGSGRLGMEIMGTEVLQYLKKVKFEIIDVELEGEGEDASATAGEVQWHPGGAGKFSLLGLDFSFDSVGILAQKGAKITGTVKHSLVPNPVHFQAELDAEGNFLGSLDSLPELEVKGFKLKAGTAFDIDMHDGKSPGTLEASFKGLLVRSAKLEFPEVFNGANKTPSVLEVTNFYIGTRLNDAGGRSMGFGGKAALTGSFFNMGYAGYNYSVQELSLEFENSALKSGSLKGELALPIPFEGKVSTELTVSGEGFTAKLATDRPVTMPRLGVSMTFLSGTQIEYLTATKVGKLTINAFMVTKGLGEVDIKGFELSSDGTVKAKEITMEKSIKFGSGFDLHAKSIGFSVSSDEVSITVKGGFAFPKIGIDNISGSVTVTSGPSIDVKLTGGKVHFDYNPCTFSGEFTYTGREFNGKFDIGIKKVLDNGIQGRFVVGNMETKGEESWNYWYAELTVGVKIPLGQTGLVILGLGGGLGYNYIPPIGPTEGHPQHNDAFSFKAIMEMGTQPGGEVFAGRMEMVLVPGMFTLYGKCWMLTQKESLYGEGQLNLQWSPTAQIDGYIAMFVGIPDAKGGIFQAQGKINFLFAGTTNFYIKSEVLKASVLQSINGEAGIDINTQFMAINGKLYYKLNKSLPLGIVTAKVSVNATADGNLKYAYQSKTLNAAVSFVGNWDVDLETPLGTADITNGAINLAATLTASPTAIEVQASANITYDLWVYAGSAKLDLGYKVNL